MSNLAKPATLETVSPAESPMTGGRLRAQARRAHRRLVAGMDLVNALRRRDLARVMIFLGELERG